MDPKDMELAIIRNLPGKTGKTIDEWVAVVRGFGPEGRKARVAWLMSVHNLGHFQARIIAAKAERAEDSESSLVAELFSKASPRALDAYGAVLALLRSLGDDITVTPSPRDITFSRAKRFLVLRPTDSGLIVGLRLMDPPSVTRVTEPHDFPGERFISHQIAIESPMDVDNVVSNLIKEAYHCAI
jgi:hypothetical protein